jgi:hypothetical protein
MALRDSAASRRHAQASACRYPRLNKKPDGGEPSGHGSFSLF